MASQSIHGLVIEMIGTSVWNVNHLFVHLISLTRSRRKSSMCGQFEGVYLCVSVCFIAVYLTPNCQKHVSNLVWVSWWLLQSLLAVIVVVSRAD